MGPKRERRERLFWGALPLRQLPRRHSPILAAKAFAKRRALAFSAEVAARSLAGRWSASSLSWSLMAMIPSFSTLYNLRDV
jgi:hypothetical protein